MELILIREKAAAAAAVTMVVAVVEVNPVEAAAEEEEVLPMLSLVHQTLLITKVVVQILIRMAHYQYLIIQQVPQLTEIYSLKEKIGRMKAQIFQHREIWKRGVLDQ